MKKQIVVLVFLFVWVLLSSSAQAERQPAEFTFTRNEEDFTLAWGSGLEEIAACGINGMTAEAFYPARLPLWADPSVMSPAVAGYTAASSTVKIRFHGLDVDRAELYCYCGRNEDGEMEREQAQLYMVKLEKYAYPDEGMLSALLEELFATFGQAKEEEATTQGFAMITTDQGIYNGPVTTIRRTYTWRGANHTGLRLTADYNDFRQSYDSIIIYLGMTNLDEALMEAADNAAVQASPEQVTVEKRIALRDENKQSVMRLEEGTMLHVVGYDKALNMFEVVVVDESGESSSEPISGYVHGDNLSTSREELLRLFPQ